MPSKNTTTALRSKNASDTPKGRFKTFRLGRISAAVWRNTTDGKTFFNVTFTRYYRTEDGEYHYVSSFGRDDLPLIAKLANQAHSFIFEQRTDRRSSEAAD